MWRRQQPLVNLQDVRDDLSNVMDKLMAMDDKLNRILWLLDDEGDEDGGTEEEEPF
ncbi:MAG: hypothetical protein HY511_00175 [Actinobacteria bacterium]|nr:hypothetical protein [Actinomycetota bacterium]